MSRSIMKVNCADVFVDLCLGEAQSPLSRKKDRKSFVFDSTPSLLSWGRPTGLAGDTREEDGLVAYKHVSV